MANANQLHNDNGVIRYQVGKTKGDIVRLRPYTHLVEVWQTCESSYWLLWILDQSQYQNERRLRLFACWCARQANDLLDNRPLLRVVLVAEEFARGFATVEELKAAREADSGRAAGAGVIGLPRRIPGAAAQLSAWHTSNDDALRAAYWSASYTVCAASFAACSRKESDAESAASSLQASQLKQMVGNPFHLGDVKIEPSTLAYWLVLGFVPQMQEEGWTFFSTRLRVRANLTTLLVQYAP